MCIRDRPEAFDSVSYTKICQSKIIKSAEKAKCEQESKRLYDLIKESGKAVVKVDSKIFPGARIYIEAKVYEPADTLVPVSYTHLVNGKFHNGEKYGILFLV